MKNKYYFNIFNSTRTNGPSDWSISESGRCRSCPVQTEGTRVDTMSDGLTWPTRVGGRFVGDTLFSERTREMNESGTRYVCGKVGTLGEGLCLRRGILVMQCYVLFN